MDDWYSVLQVAPGADAEVIATAHRWLAQRYDPANDSSEEAAAALQRVNEAFAVLSDPLRRADYDDSRGLAGPASTSTPAVAMQPSPEPASHAAAASTSRVATVMLGVVVGITFFVALGVAITAAITGREETTYNDKLGDGDYDLEHMALTESDIPADLEFAASGEFEVEEWASLYDVVDEADLSVIVTKLESDGWVKNYVAEAGRSGFGKLLGMKSVSTLYANEEKAVKATGEGTCGLPIELSEQLDEFIVPSIADQTVGFLHRRPLRDENGQTVITFVDTTVCFRTGRIVHAVQETALEGVHDIASSIRTAYVLLEHVNDAYEGNVSDTDEEDDEEG